MKTRMTMLLMFVAALGSSYLQAAEPEKKDQPPLTLVRTFELPDVPLGPYADHPSVDIKGRRLFACAQAHQSVKVFDLDTGKELHDLLGVENPHSVVYREDIDQIYVTDGGAGLVRVYSGQDYHPIKEIKLLLDADTSKYDPRTKYLYVDNGGKGASLDYSLISIIDTSTSQRVGDIRFSAQSLEGIALEAKTDKGYVSLTDKNAIAVFDRKRGSVVATWALTKGRKNIPLTLDEERHRLFAGCRNTEETGTIVVLDTQTGKEIDSLPIAGWVDDIGFDVKRKRLYATCGKAADGVGAVYVYQETSSGHYRLIGTPATAPMAKAGLFVPELDRIFVAVPHNERTSSKILEFKIE